MPTYDYRCDACEHEFEEFQSMTARPLKKCPECGKLKLKRLIGAGAGIIFKGGGFYETDYRSDSYKQAAKAEREGASSDKKTDAGASASDSKASESKPAAKSDGNAKPAAKKPAAGKPKAKKD